MGQCSLENYEKYKTHKIRPQISDTHPDNRGCKKFTAVTLFWREAEPERGHFNFESIQKELQAANNPLLYLEMTPPGWAREPLEDLYRSFVFKLGSVLDQGQLVGLFLDSTHFSPNILNAFSQAFQKTPLILDLADIDAQAHFHKSGTAFGLRVSLQKNQILECRELFARQGVQHLWKIAPVLLQLPDSQSTPALYSQAERWHVSFSSEDMDVGYRFELRKLAYPKEISSGGALPLRFWFVNTGTAPCYEPVTAMLRLSGADKGCDTKLNIQALQGKTGDLVHNEIAKLPALPTGEYTVSLGLKIGEHPLALANALTASDGFYALGKVLVDQQNRDDLFHIWEDYYPEGYYPLEDPQAPNESGEEQQSGGDGK